MQTAHHHCTEAALCHPALPRVYTQSWYTLCILCTILHNLFTLKFFPHSAHCRFSGGYLCAMYFTWVLHNMSGNFVFNFAFNSLHTLSTSALKMLARLFVCLFVFLSPHIYAHPLSHSNHTVWKVFAHFVCFVSFCTQIIPTTLLMLTT